MTDEELKALVVRLDECVDNIESLGWRDIAHASDAIEHLMAERDEKTRMYNELVEDVRAARSEAYEQGREAMAAENARLREALKIALPRLVHLPDCRTMPPAADWATRGIITFENCRCEISIVKAALKGGEK